jgi:hypothetical protein
VFRSNQLGYFPIALCFGQPKPVNLQFLAEAIAELEVLFEQGIKTKSGQCHACYGFPYTVVCVKQSSHYLVILAVTSVTLQGSVTYSRCIPEV